MKININLLRSICLGKDSLSKGSEEEIDDRLLSTRIVRLDFQDIEEISGLEVLSNATELYLQYNLISRVENIEFLVNLKWLSLNNNNINYISDISALDKLQYLNLADNGNPCALESSYESVLIENLPSLREIDDKIVSEDGAVIDKEFIGKIENELEEYTEEEQAESKADDDLMKKKKDLYEQSIELQHMLQERISQAITNEDRIQELKDKISSKRALISERASERVYKFKAHAENVMQDIAKIEEEVFSKIQSEEEKKV